MISLAILLVWLIYLMGLFDSLHFSSPKIIKAKNHYRILTFNIAHGRGRALNQFMVPNFRRKEICNTIGLFCKASNADFILFQESDFYATWSGNFNHLNAINQKAEYPHKREGNNNVLDSYLNNQYGNSILSKFEPINSSNTIFSEKSIGGKGVVQITIKLKENLLTIFNLHLQHNSIDVRRKQLNIVEKLILKTKTPYIIAGDFNEKIESELLKSFIKRHHLHRYEGKESSISSFRFSFLNSRIDFILGTKEIIFHQCEIQKTNLSDHMPIIMDFSIRP
ncbi:MAG: hypothetical protein COA79_15340 [Planctomycetota bacterium]|nr:MAG: hypothetical protein COA79_15340 [Planctomycetota bacterium]